MGSNKVQICQKIKLIDISKFKNPIKNANDIPLNSELELFMHDLII